MQNSIRISLLILLVASFVGCRTYGGYGSEEATLRQIEAAQVQLSRDLVQARNDLRSLQASAAGSAQLQAAANAYEGVVRAHEALVAEHEAIVEEARSNNDAYRFLSRTLRGMHSEQQNLHQRYRDILHGVRSAAVMGAPTRPGTVIPRYHVVPPFYERIENADYITSVGGAWRALPAGAASAVTSDQAGDAGPDQDAGPVDPATPGTPADGGEGAAPGERDADAGTADETDL